MPPRLRHGAAARPSGPRSATGRGCPRAARPSSRTAGRRPFEPREEAGVDRQVDACPLGPHIGRDEAGLGPSGSPSRRSSGPVTAKLTRGLVRSTRATQARSGPSGVSRTSASTRMGGRADAAEPTTRRGRGREHGGQCSLPSDATIVRGCLGPVAARAASRGLAAVGCVVWPQAPAPRRVHAARGGPPASRPRRGGADRRPLAPGYAEGHVPGAITSLRARSRDGRPRSGRWAGCRSSTVADRTSTRAPGRRARCRRRASTLAFSPGASAAGGDGPLPDPGPTPESPPARRGRSS